MYGTLIERFLQIIGIVHCRGNNAIVRCLFANLDSPESLVYEYRFFFAPSSVCRTQSLVAWIAAGGTTTESEPCRFGSCSLGIDVKYWSNATSHCKHFLITGLTTHGISYPDKKHEDEYVT